MTPHRSHRRGTFVIDRLFDGVGRIRRASGTTDRRVFRKIQAMLSAFAIQSRHDLLIGIRDGTIRPTFALTWYTQNKIDRIPTAQVLPPLGETFDAWRAGLDCSPDHRKNLGTTRRHLAIEAHHIIADAPDLLERYRARAAHQPSSFNKARVHLLAFLRDHVGMSHPLWCRVSDSRPAKLPPRARRTQLSPDDVRRLVVQLGPEHGDIAWGMVATGMGPKEFWGDWTELPDRIHVEGTKRVGRVRDVPRWTRVSKPARSFAQFRKVLREKGGGTVRPYDFRRAFARWLTEAGVNSVNQAAYLGHGPRTMSDLYELGELPGQFFEDAARLRRYTGEPELVPALRMTVAG